MLTGNVGKFRAARAAQGLAFGFATPILTLFFLDKGLNLTQFMVLMGVLNVTITLCEIPTGVVADRVGRKISISVGLSLWFAAFLLMLVTRVYPVLLIAFALWGIAETFVSGADTALLYDSLKAEGREKEAQRIMGTNGAIMQASLVVGSLLSAPLVAATSVRAPMWFALGALPAMLLFFLLMREPTVEQDPGTSPGAAGFRGYLTHSRDSLRTITGSSVVFALILAQVVFQRLFFLTDRPFAQPYLIWVGLAPRDLGFLYAAFGVVNAVCSRLSGAVSRILGDRESRTFLLSFSLALASLAVFAVLGRPAAVIISLLVSHGLRGLSTPAIMASLNRRISSERRAACLSISSASNHFLGMILGPLYGLICDVHSLRVGLLAFLLSFGPLLVLSCRLLVSALHRESKEGRPFAV